VSAATAEGRSAIVAEGIVKQFRGVRALDGVDMTVAEREIVGMIGPNGSGKTTLLNVASGVLRPTAGRVEVGGQAATGRLPHVFARLGVGRTFQQIRLFGDMTVRENVEVGAVAGGQPLATVDPLLAQIGLEVDSERMAATLSYGQQRRVEIARALAGGPRFLLLDEPAAGMNERESDDLLETIKVVRDERGLGVLIVDHDLRLIMRLCERIHVLAEGRTICEGPPRAVRHDRGVIEAYLGTSAGGAGAAAGSDRTRRKVRNERHGQGAGGDRGCGCRDTRGHGRELRGPAGGEAHDGAEDRVLGRAQRRVRGL
jgi:branched-chain amino acid transport system ATP-binding protein